MDCPKCKNVSLIRINFPKATCTNVKGKTLPKAVDRCPKCMKDFEVK